MEQTRILFDYNLKEHSKSSAGPSIHGFYLASGLSSHAKLYAITIRSKPEIIEKETGVTIPLDIFYVSWLPVFLDGMIRSLNIIIKKIKIDVVYARYNYNHLRYLGYYFSKLKKLPLVLELNGIPWQERNYFLFRFRFYRHFKLRPFKKASRIICVSEGIKRSLLEMISLDANKISVVQNGMAVSRNDLSLPTQELKKLENIKDSKKSEKSFYIGFVGIIERWQGFDRLIDVSRHYYSQLKSKRIVFLIIGAGPYLKSLKRTIHEENLSDVFKFIGPVPHKYIYRYIYSFDIAIAPLSPLRNASPIKIFEYLSCEKPVIVSDIPDVRSLDLDKGLIYFDPSNTKDLWDKISYATNNLRVINKKMPAVSRHVKSQYSWHESARKVWSVISNLS